MSQADRSRLNTRAYEEASEWFVEFRAGAVTAAARREFSEWVRSSPEHVRAYLEIAAIWNEGAALDSALRYGEQQLIELAALEPTNVVPLAGAVATRQPHAAARRPATARRLTVAASLVVALGGLFAWLHLNQGVYRTELGEQRSFALADGSTVQLNSRSRVRIRFSEAQRAIELLEGQALFEVAKDRARPFIVISDGVQVRAVGTQFDVYRREDGTTVTVLEGHVAVEVTRGGSGPAMAATASVSAGAASPAMVLGAGEQVTVKPGLTAKPTKADVAAVTAWTRRHIVFDSASLAEVVAEFNRYNRRQIVLKDADVVDFHISGVFSSSNPEALIRFLRDRGQIEVVETASDIQISRR